MSIEFPFKHITIVGLGLIGSSIATKVKAQFNSPIIRGVSSPATLKKALKEGLIDQACHYDDSAAFEETEFILLCTPISHVLELFNRWSQSTPSFSKQVLITDVGSSKNTICHKAHEALKDLPHVNFIGSHPMAGSEKSGYEARDLHLFENSAWIICPEKNTDPKQLNQLQQFSQCLGARNVVLTSELHDTIVAHISHLPQLLATALAGFTSTQPQIMEDGLPISGSGFYDMTRLASSSFEMWKPIFESNQKDIANALEKFIQYLEQVKTAFQNNNIQPYFTKGQELRERLNQKSKGFARDNVNLLVTIPDKPKALESMLKPLSQSNINVADLEILKVREGEGGTVRLAFLKLKEAEDAYNCLKQNHFEVQLRD